MNHNRTLTFLICLVAIAGNSYGQSFKEQFNKHAKENDTSAQLKVLNDWSVADSNDAELYVAWFNYYANNSRRELITIGANPQGDNVLTISDSTGKPAGYIYGDVHYNIPVLEKGFGYIEKGVRKFPNRLDMRFGKIYMLGQLKSYEPFTLEIIRTIEYFGKSGNAWTWTDNEPLEDPKGFMLTSIQTYQLQLYNTNDDLLLGNMAQIAIAVLKLYPDHIESLSNLAIVYIITKKYDPALESLLKAEKLSPEDNIVLNNIAHVYKLKGDKENAIRYYQLLIKYGDEREIENAKREIEELKK